MSEKYVTQAVFIKETKEIRNRFDQLAVALVETQHEVKEIKNTMATKHDVNRIVDQIDAFTKTYRDLDRDVIVIDHRLMNLEPIVQAHEKRLTNLEGPSK